MQVISYADLMAKAGSVQHEGVQQSVRWIYDTVVASIRETWAPPGGPWVVFNDGEVDRVSSDKFTRNFGVERKTEVAALKAAKRMKEHNRLLAYAEEYCPDNTFTPGDGDTNWTVMKIESQWSITSNDVYIPGMVYMTRYVAYDLACKLNNGEVSFDG